MPYAQMLLAYLALETLVLVIDGSTVGRGGVALMVHVVYKGRALPLAWLVRQGKKGHFPEEMHIALVEYVRDLLPLGVEVDKTRIEQATEIIKQSNEVLKQASESPITADLSRKPRGITDKIGTLATR